MKVSKQTTISKHEYGFIFYSVLKCVFNEVKVTTIMEFYKWEKRILT
jgi:hypothetical protein